MEINRKMLPLKEQAAVVNQDQLFEAELKKLDTLILQAKNVYNRAEYALAVLEDKKRKTENVKYKIQCLCMGNADRIFTTREINRYTTIPMRTIEVHVKEMVEAGMLEKVDYRKFRMIKKYVDVG